MADFLEDFARNQSMGGDFDQSSFGADFGYQYPGGEFGADPKANFDDVVVGIPPLVFGGAGTLEVEVRPTQAFRVDRLVLSAASQAAGVRIDQIDISSILQNRGNGPLPGSMFTDDARHRLGGTIVQPSSGITLRVTAPGALTFSGALYGPAAGEAPARSVGNMDYVAIGIPVTTINAGATQTVRVEVTQNCFVEKLVLGSAFAVAGCTVDQIAIGSVNQNRGRGGATTPAEVWTPRASTRLRGTLVRPGTGIDLTVTNGTAGNLVLDGAFFGPAFWE